ncbi:D-hexose-6-phosphate mutarotase [Oceanisphaera avium]|uniref:D-hexose-6-phosphate mutarotase n=1 Tax=Oceanisphaera avium TaxID=1903694 RepID=UPI0018DF7330|nr:D-hexose-6-phosphate mutarotase [Oceanisphaera avium]
MPFHGFARTSNWQLSDSQASANAVELTLVLDVSNGHEHYWPHSAKLELQVCLTDTLTLRLNNYNLGHEALAISQALHSYFAISDIRHIQLTGFEQSTYHDCLQQWQAKAQAGAITFNGETDRVYLNVPTQVQLIDSGWQRRIQLQAQGSHSAIVWNPWIDKARQLSGFADEAWSNMVCIETANVLDDHLTLNAGEHHQLVLEISCTTQP